MIKVVTVGLLLVLLAKAPVLQAEETTQEICAAWQYFAQKAIEARLQGRSASDAVDAVEAPNESLRQLMVDIVLDAYEVPYVDGVTDHEDVKNRFVNQQYVECMRTM